MTKTRLFGIALLIAGIIIMFKIDNDLYSFIGGVLFGIGVGIIISGKTIFSKKEPK